MTLKLKLFLCSTLGLNIYLFTPQILSDTIYGMKFGLIKFIYMDDDNNVISYTFNHNKFDGKLMAYTIQQELVEYEMEKDANIYDFKPYQYLNNNRILHPI